MRLDCVGIEVSTARKWNKAAQLWLEVLLIHCNQNLVQAFNCAKLYDDMFLNW